jgi:hypothetical protein
MDFEVDRWLKAQYLIAAWINGASNVLSVKFLNIYSWRFMQVEHN